MEQFVIYRNPLDFPGEYVVRRFEIEAGRVIPRECLYHGTSLAAARMVASGPGGWRICFMRDEKDDPTILETWL